MFLRLITLRLPFVSVVLILTVFGCVQHLEAATHKWAGPASGGNWSNAANWTNGKPTTGEVGGTIVFFSSNITSTCDIAGLVVDLIQFGGTGNTVNGTAGTTTLGINGNNLVTNIQNDTGTNTLGATLPINFANGAAVLAAVNGGSLTIAGNISGGSNGFVVNNAASATLNLTSATNTYAGATNVEGGKLALNSGGFNTAIPGDLIIGLSSGTANSAIVQLLQSIEIADTSNVTINATGLFDLNNFSETIGTLTVIGGNVTLGTGSLVTNSTVTMTSGSITGASGSLFSLGGDITATSVGSTGASISCNVNLNNTTRTVTVNPGAVQPELTITGVVADGNVTPSGLKKSGTGTLNLLGNAANTFTGTTTVDKGVVQIAAAVGVIIPGALTIGNGVDPANSAILRENIQSSDIAVTSAVTINASGTLDMNTEQDTIGSLTGSGNVLIASSGSLSVGNATSTTFSGSISGNGTFTKIGAGTLALTGNSNAGLLVVNTGTLQLNSSSQNSTTIGGSLKIGAGTGAANSAVVRLFQSNQIGDASAITINSDGVLDMNGFGDVAGAMTINGGNVTLGAGSINLSGILTMAGGSIRATTGSLTLNADLTATSSAASGASIVSSLFLAGIRTFTVNSGSIQPELTVNGAITDFSGSGPSGIFKSGTGTLSLVSAAGNTNTGPTTVDKGVLSMDASVGNIIPGALTIGNNTDPANSATVIEQNSSDLNQNSSLTINASGLLNMNNFSDIVDGLSGTGNLSLSSNSSLKVGFNNGSATFSGVFSGTGTLSKSGTGTQTLASNNTYTGATTVLAGTLVVNGSQSASAVLVQGGTLAGNGSTGAVTLSNSADLSPGVAGPGTLSTGNLTLVSTNTFLADFNTSASGGFDSVSVTGTVSLGGSTLTFNAGPNFAATAGTKIVLIANDGTDAVTGTFKALPEGAMVSVGTQVLSISYAGGTGNDVELTAQNIPPVISAAASAAPSPAGVGQTVTLMATATDANLDTIAYTWSFGDQSNGTGASTTHAYAAPGTYTATVTADDGHGGVVTSSTMVVVNAPAITTAASATPSPANTGQAVSFSVSASDFNPSALTYTWNFGDNSNGTGANTTHTYTVPGTYNISVTVDNGLGGHATSNTSLTVAMSVAPLITSAATASGVEGSSFSFTLTASGTAPITFTTSTLPAGLTLNNGTISGTPTVAGAAQITITAANSAGNATQTLTITISNPAGTTDAGPAFTSSPAANPNPGVSGAPVSFTAAASDADGDLIAYTWNFGDGTSGTGASTTHVYAAPGLYTVVVSASDAAITVSDSLVLGINSVASAPAPGSFGLSKGTLRFDFKKQGDDSLALSGTLVLAPNFKPAGKSVLLDIGGYSHAFTLDAHAKAGDSFNTLKITGKTKKGVFTSTAGKLAIALKKQSLFAAFAPFGFPAGTVAKPGVKVTLTALIDVDGTSLLGTIKLNYVAKDKVNGSAH